MLIVYGKFNIAIVIALVIVLYILFLTVENINSNIVCINIKIEQIKL